MAGDILVRAYLERLEAAASRLSVDRRIELLNDVRGHIETALAEAGNRDEATVRTVLDRLGPPGSIVDGEAPPEAAPAPALFAQAVVPAPHAGFGALEIVALLLLTVGSVALPIIGPIAGLVLVWASPQWETRHKAVATAIVVVLLAVPVLLFAVVASTPFGAAD